MNNVTVALISGLSSVAVGILTLIGVILSSGKTNRDVQSSLATAQAVTETKLDALTREVQGHNNFAKRIPVIEEQLRVTNHRITNLEKNERSTMPLC